MLVGMAAHKENVVVADTRKSLSDFMTAVACAKDALEAMLKRAKPKEKMDIIKALQSNNLDHRLEHITRAVFSALFERIEKTERALKECVDAMKQAVGYAMMKEFGEDAGTISWRSLNDIMMTAGDVVDDDLKDLRNMLLLLVVGCWCWLLVVGCWLFVVVGCWLLVVSCWRWCWCWLLVVVVGCGCWCWLWL
jgi:3',5'-cyclic AMP phosphodiesterase CpdA